MRRRQRKRRLAGDPIVLPSLTAPRQRWSMDFLRRTLAGWASVLHAQYRRRFTRECLAIEVDRSLPGVRVIRVLERLAARVGLPALIVVDNGPESVSRAVDAWTYVHYVSLRFTRPFKPVENAYIESFNGKCRG